MGEWPEVPFADAIDFQEGPGIMAADFRHQGVPLIRLAGLERGGSVLAGCNFLDPSTVRKRWAHFALREGDILLSSSASLGRIAVVGPDAEGAIPYTGIIRMRPRDERVHAPFIQYLLEAPDFQRQAEIAGVGSVMRHFGPMHLRQMTVRLPPIGTQRRITEVLGALDDKIELNRRTSETLEAMARALFRSWFVDCDPVRAKAERRDPGLPPHLADLFPDRLVDSDLGKIPEGWGVAPLRQIASLSRSAIDPQLVPGEIFRHHSIPAFDAGRQPAVDIGGSIKSLKYEVHRESVLLSKLNPEIERVWLPDVRPGKRAICSTEFLVLVPRHPVGQSYLYELLISTGFRRRLEGLVTGTSRSHQRAQPEAVLEIGVLVPPLAVLAAFEREVSPLVERVKLALRQAVSLEEVRDALLPRLLTGEVEPASVSWTGADR